MYKITRLYKDGVRMEQEPVFACVVAFRETSEGRIATARLEGLYDALDLRRAEVVEIDTCLKRFTITGIEEGPCDNDEIVGFAQAWKVEEV